MCVLTFFEARGGKPSLASRNLANSGSNLISEEPPCKMQAWPEPETILKTEPVFSFLSKPSVVGAITDSNALLSDFDSADCDCIELRLDRLGNGAEVIAFCERHQSRLPLLLTARDSAQGGLGEHTALQREALLRSLLSYASAIDVEFSNFERFSSLLSEARRSYIAIVGSSHDFEGFDETETHRMIQAAQAAGTTVAKAAVMLRDARDFARFEALSSQLTGSQFSLMGMGPYGPASRLLAAQHGSLLNYGYLGEQATAPGQWPAALLKQVIAATPPFHSPSA